VPAPVPNKGVQATAYSLRIKESKMADAIVKDNHYSSFSHGNRFVKRDFASFMFLLTTTVTNENPDSNE
jgi:hypothetical protein